jgi:hypothetical protein
MPALSFTDSSARNDRLHSEYARARMRSLAGQAAEMGQIVSRAAMDAAKPKS